MLSLYAIIVGSLVRRSIHSITGWVKAKTQRKCLKERIHQIGMLDTNATEEMITGYYIDGKINILSIEKEYRKPEGIAATMSLMIIVFL